LRPSPHKFEFADQLLLYIPRFDEYGIIIHDGGNSHSVIQFCPWCGKKLPQSAITIPPTKKSPLSSTDEWYRRRQNVR
jgi:hypothetical protein